MPPSMTRTPEIPAAALSLVCTRGQGRADVFARSTCLAASETTVGFPFRQCPEQQLLSNGVSQQRLFALVSGSHRRIVFVSNPSMLYFSLLR